MHTKIFHIKAILFLFFLALNVFSIHGQTIHNSSNIWYFGNKAGLDFNNTPPTALTDGQLNTQEGVATISNNSGELLFYTDGITVWDRTHQPMPNGNGTLNGHFSSTQSALIVPHLGDADLFFIFTTDELGGINGLSYSIVDVTLPGNGDINSPLGNIVNGQMNIQLATPVTEKIVGILKNNNDGYWVVAHGWNSSIFYAFEIDCDGINPDPVISSIGNVHTGGTNNINAVGYMKSSIDGDKIALVNRNNDSVDLYDFDNNTGTVSNEVEIIPNDILLYGIEFSPSGDYLYIGGTDIISRYSLSTGNLIDINIDSNAPFAGNNGVRALQLGPDENIYVSIRNWDFISVIYNPDEPNPTLTTNGIYLDPDNAGRKCRFGLPNIFYIELPPSPDSITVHTCPNVPVDYNGEIYQPGTINEVHLVNNSGCDSTVILTIEEYIVYEQTLEVDACFGSFYEFNGVQIPAGTQELFTLIDNNGCDSIITVIVNEVEIIEENIIEELCEGETFFFNNEEYQIGTDTVFQFIDQNGCENIVTLLLLPSPELEFDLTSESSCSTSNTGSIIISNIQGGVPPFEFSIDTQTYFSDTLINNLAPSLYYLQIVDANGCSFHQDIEVTSIPEFSIAYPETILSCEDDSVRLEVTLFNINQNEVLWNWSDGSESNYTYASQPGLYQLEISNECQTISEEINVEIDEDERQNFIYIPNAFSPNFDGINDFFQLYPAHDIELISFEIQIFNRWGGRIFTSNDISFSWDGMFKEKMLNPGVYVWWLQAEIISCKKNIDIFEKGDVTIIR